MTEITTTVETPEPEGERPPEESVAEAMHLEALRTELREYRESHEQVHRDLEARLAANESAAQAAGSSAVEAELAAAEAAAVAAAAAAESEAPEPIELEVPPTPSLEDSEASEEAERPMLHRILLG